MYYLVVVTIIRFKSWRIDSFPNTPPPPPPQKRRSAPTPRRIFKLYAHDFQLYLHIFYIVRMDSRKLKRRRIQQAYEDAEVNEEFEQEAVAPDEIAVPEETDIIDRKEGATTSLESNFKESVAKRILSEAAAKLAKAKEGLAIALSEEAATRVELDKLSSNVTAWREKVAEAEREWGSCMEKIYVF